MDRTEVDSHLTVEWYAALKAEIIRSGYAHEIDWAQSVQPVSDPLEFWQEFAFVVINSGMKNTIARKIWDKVRTAVLAGESARSVFGHPGKAAAIDNVYKNRVSLVKDYLDAEDKLTFLKTLPWIGSITCFHLAKNYGLDFAKPDRHLVRIAGAEGTHALCARLSAETGDRIATVDLVIWRAASLGIV